MEERVHVLMTVSSSHSYDQISVRTKILYKVFMYHPFNCELIKLPFCGSIFSEKKNDKHTHTKNCRIRDIIYIAGSKKE